MSATSSSFFVTGGTLRPDAPCYVGRAADQEILEGLTQGDFCYVLTSRQMGKSSLMVRTVQRLRKSQFAVAVLDLTAIGQNLTVEQWYNGLIERLGRQLDREDEFEQFWREHQQLSPVQRWVAALHEIGLTAPDAKNGFVIFIDEIDAVRSLPFSTDEFFAAIRECFNRRSDEPEFKRLTFCLLGVATPSGLIRDTRTTPFNVGRRIELRDFTADEAAPLLAGLENRFNATLAGKILKRVIYWTNGQPYLTQVFCRSIVERDHIATVHDVDQLCSELFLSEQARDKNDNLVFVRERLLRSEVDQFELLELYRMVWHDRPVENNPSNPLVCVLRLSGITRDEDGQLKIRSPIYRKVFNNRWVDMNLPDAELRRQREAYHRGLFRAALTASLVLLVIGYLWLDAYRQAMRADSSATSEMVARHKAEKSQREAEAATSQVTDVLSQMEMQQAEEMFTSDRSSVGLAYLAHLLRNNPSNRVAAHRLVFALSQRSFATVIPESDRSLPTDLNPTESANRARIYSRVSETNENEVLVFAVSDGRLLSRLRHEGPVLATDVAPEGVRVVTASMDDTARVWNGETGEALTPPLRHHGPVFTARFSPEGLRVATAGADRTVRLWDAATGRPLLEPFIYERGARSVSFNRKGDQLYVQSRFGRGRGSTRGWEIQPHGMIARPLYHDGRVLITQFDRNNRWLLTATDKGIARLWDVPTGNLISNTPAHTSPLIAARFSPVNDVLLTATRSSEITLWELPTFRKIRSLGDSKGGLVTADFNHDGSRILIARNDGNIVLLPLSTNTPLVELKVPSQLISAELNATGKKVVTVSADRKVRIWDAANGELISDQIGHFGSVFGAHFSPTASRIVTLSVGMARLWNLESAEGEAQPLEHNSAIRHAAFSSDGLRVVTTSSDRTARLWDSTTGDPIGMPLLHNGSVIHAAFFQNDTHLLTTTGLHQNRIWDIANGQPISELFGASHLHTFAGLNFDRHRATSLSSNGKYFASPSEDQVVRIWEILDPPIPAPDWLPALAEGIGGEYINQRGTVVSTGRRQLQQLGERLAKDSTGTFYGQWAKWLITGGRQRPISPGSTLTQENVVTALLKTGTPRAIREASLLAPDDPRVMAELSLMLAMENPDAESLPRKQADFLSFVSVELGKRNLMIRLARVAFLERTGNIGAAIAACDAATQLARKAGDKEILQALAKKRIELEVSLRQN